MVSVYGTCRFSGGSLITRPEILTRALLSGGTEEQKSHWLPQIAAGSKLCGIAITEPDYGSDVAALSLKAVRTEGGWLLNGAKAWCTFAGKAEVLFVIARTESDKSLGQIDCQLGKTELQSRFSYPICQILTGFLLPIFVPLSCHL